MTHRVFHDRVIADASQCGRDGVLRRSDLEGLARRHLGRGILVFLAVLGAKSVANVWVQAVLGSSGSLFGRTIERGQGATPIAAETRGSGNV